MKQNIIKERSFNFALEIVSQYKILVSERREFVMAKQLLRSGTSIGANVREAEHAESKPDFIHKIAVALKEANETDYWIDLLYQSKYLVESEFTSLKSKIEEILRLLISILNTSKNK